MSVDRHEVKERIRRFMLESYPHDGRVLEDETALLEEWFVDSIGIVLTVAFLEETFGIDIRSADVIQENFRSVGTLAEFVCARLGRV